MHTEVTPSKQPSADYPWIGPTFAPGDPGYTEEIRTYNESLEHRPQLVVGAVEVSDVVSAVRYGGNHGLSVAVQATGHGLCLPSEGVLVSTRRMKGVTVDPVARTARIEAGARWLDVVPIAAEYGLAPLNGSSPQVGAVGFTLGGGIGMLGRQHGYGADHVRSFTIVTADGAARHVTPDVEPDLFWAVRGGKGNFGIVTEMEIDLFEVNELYGGGLYFPAEKTGELLSLYTSWTRGLPGTMSTSILLLGYPDIEQVRPELRGRYVAHLRVAFFGSAVEAEELLRPIRALGAPLLDTVCEMSYADIGTIHHEPVGPYADHGSGFHTDRLDEGDARTILKHVGPDAEMPVMLELRHHGAAYRQSPGVANPIAGRDAEFTIYLGSLIDPPHMVADKHAHAAIRSSLEHVDRGAVLNFLGNHADQETIRSAYSEADRSRLLSLQAKYDPDDMFRINLRLQAG